MKFRIFGLTVLFMLGADLALAKEEWVFRDLKANTLPAPKCEAKAEAELSAASPKNLDRYTQRFCQTQGYGWHLTEVKDIGKTVCEKCGDDGAGSYRCNLQDVVVTCKRLKPGSVGMLPNEITD
ncbi:MAG: hypothetical protein ACU826_00025 [Gammaproteobacteria bacterium]